MPYRELPELVGFDPPFGCTYDAERDAIIPAQVEVTSLTDNFSITVSAQAFLFRAQNSGRLSPTDPRAMVTIEGDNTYSSRAECSNLGDAGTRLTGVQFNDVTADASRSHNFYIAVHDYLSPAHPAGDPSVLPNLGVAFNLEAGSDGSYNPIAQVCGSDVVYNDEPDLGERAFALLPFVANHDFTEANNFHSATVAGC